MPNQKDIDKQIADLNKQAEQLKEARQQKIIEEELAKMRKEVGKYYATHLLNRYLTKKHSFRLQLMHITDVGHDKTIYRNYYYVVDYISVFKDGNEWTITQKIQKISDVHIYLNHKITKEQFEHVKATLVPSIEHTLNKIRTSFQAQLYISSGDHSDDGRRATLFDEMGYDYIEFADKTKNLLFGSNISLYDILRYNYHPYLLNTRLYKAPGWLDMVIKIRDKMEKDAYSWGGTILERDVPRIKTLTQFIQKHTDNE